MTGAESREYKKETSLTGAESREYKKETSSTGAESREYKKETSWQVQRVVNNSGKSHPLLVILYV